MSFRRIISEIPAAGKTLILKQSGNAVQIESIPVYTDALDVPLIEFDTAGEKQPIYPASIYTGSLQQVTGNSFNSIILTGTEDSAGDRIILLVTDSCLQPEINTNVNQTRQQSAGDTFTMGSADTGAGFIASMLVNVAGQIATTMLVSARNEDIKFSFGVDPAPAGIGYLLKVGEKVRIDGSEFIQSFKFCSAAASVHGQLDVTLGF